MDITTFTTTVAEFFHRPDWYQNWVLQVLVVLFLTLLVNLIQRRVLNRLLARLEKNTAYWDDVVVLALRRPLSVLILVVGLGFALDIIRSEAEAVIFEAVDPVRTVSIIVILAWFLVRLIKQGEDGIIAQREAVGEPYDRTTLDAIAKLLRVSVTIAATLVALQTLGFSVSGVLAFGGIGGLAVGFAAKDLLANFLGGLTIYLDRPFAVGDWIRSPDRDLEGTVEHIGWRLTRIRTFDKRPLYVPNSTFSTIAVENPSRMHHRRIYETIGIRYEDAGKMAAIVSDVEQMLRGYPEIETQATLMVNFTTFAPSSLDFFIYTFTKTTDWAKYHQVKQDVLLRIIEIVETHNAEIAFPTSTVHLANSFGAGQEMPAQQLDYPVPSP
jgi:MscS family membrane protein